MEESKVLAIVLAGGQASPEIQQRFGVAHRALLRVEGVRLLDRVVHALKESEAVSAIVIVGNVPTVEGCRVLPDSGDFVENVLRPVEGLPAEQFVLYATADVPFLSPQAVRDFIQRSRLTGAEMCYPIIPMERCQQEYPHLPRTALRLREGTFTGGNLLWIRVATLRRQADLLRRAFSARKSVWAMANILGAPMITRLVLARFLSPSWLSIAHVRRRVEQLMRASAREIITDYAEIGVDIDKPEHIYRLVEAGYRVG